MRKKIRDDNNNGEGEEIIHEILKYFLNDDDSKA